MGTIKNNSVILRIMRQENCCISTKNMHNDCCKATALMCKSNITNCCEE